MLISGLASGIDWQSMVEQLIDIERRPMLLIQQRKDALSLEKSAWQDVEKTVTTLMNKAEALLDTSFDAKLATSSDTSVLRATAQSTAVAATYQVKALQLAQSHQVRSKQVADVNADLGLSGTFSLGGDGTLYGVTVEATDSLSELAAKINAAEAGVTATIIDRHLVITRDDTGSTEISFQDSSSNPGEGILTSLEILNSDDTAVAHQMAAAQDAQVEINGLLVTRSSNEIDDALEGVSLSLITASPSDGAGGQESLTLTVKADVDSVAADIKAFINQYNSTMSIIGAKLDAEAGRLSGESALMYVQLDLRRKMSDAVASLSGQSVSRLSDIGISTSKDSSVLSVDDSELKDALLKDPNAVRDLFTLSDGVASKIFDRLEVLTEDKGFFDSRTTALTKTMDDMDDQIERMEIRLEKREETLMLQFAALERSLSAMQSQSSWLTQQLNWMSSYTKK